MEDYKVNLVEDENPSAAEKEETVLENAGVDTKSDNTTHKVDLSKPPKTEEKNAVQEQSTDEVPVRDESEVSEKVEEEVRSAEEPTEQEEETVLELIEEETEEKIEEPVAEVKEEVQVEEVKENNIELPENIQKVVEFMQETGGSLEDYVRLNADYSNVDDSTLLKEYYKQTKSHLDNDEVNFLIEDNFLLMKKSMMTEKSEEKN